MARFSEDLFISYAHIDNQPLTPEQKGWISRFHASLETFLSMKLGTSAKIWRDDKLRGNDVFADELVDQLAQTAVLVSVLTPRDIKSEWCTREVREFCERAERNGGVVVSNRSRVFKVLKTPIDTQESLPSVVRESLGYEFFKLEDDRTPLEFDPVYGEELAQDYHKQVNRLAWHISELLEELASEAVAGDNGGGMHANGKASIYLAECSDDRKDARESLEDELQCHGYTVLPDREMPRDEAEYAATVERLLQRCKLAIHLVGETPGTVPDGPGQTSAVALQNELAVQWSKSSALPRVIWLPDGTHSEQAPHQAFIEALHHDAEAQFGADLITGDLEALKASIHAALKHPGKLERKQPEDAVAADTTRLIYLTCTEKDRKATAPVRRYLHEQGFEVSQPAFEGDAAAVRGVHQQLMTDCDAVVLFYGAGDEAWKRTMDNELRKMPGYRGGKPLLGSFTYLADPKTGDKEDLIDLGDPHVIIGLGDSVDVEAEMSAFIGAIEHS